MQSCHPLCHDVISISIRCVINDARHFRRIQCTSSSRASLYCNPSFPIFLRRSALSGNPSLPFPPSAVALHPSPVAYQSPLSIPHPQPIILLPPSLHSHPPPLPIIPFPLRRYIVALPIWFQRPCLKTPPMRSVQQQSRRFKRCCVGTRGRLSSRRLSAPRPPSPSERLGPTCAPSPRVR